MKPERWKEVERIYEAARQRERSEREAYLEEACAGDEELRREVESLLGYEEEARDFIESPALDLAAQELAEEEGDSRIGSRIGSYRILTLLGRGGMGEVYLAEDERLDRRVALKFLPEEQRREETARRRFPREAKSAAALDHPFICKIYEAGEVDGTAFIAMEYVEGETLAEKLAKGALPLKRALETAITVVICQTWHWLVPRSRHRDRSRYRPKCAGGSALARGRSWNGRKRATRSWYGGRRGTPPRTFIGPCSQSIPRDPEHSMK